MADNTNSLSNDELWAKCQSGGPITSQDLGISSSQVPSNGTTYLTEGVNTLNFDLRTNNT